METDAPTKARIDRQRFQRNEGESHEESIGFCRGVLSVTVVG